MADTNPTEPLSVPVRRARVRQLATDGLTNRAIARQLGIHHRTVARDLDASAAPPTTTSGDRPAPRLVYPLDPQTIQDLNVLADPRTGALPAPLLRAIHAAAEHKRAAWMRMIDQATAETPTGSTLHTVTSP